MTQLGPLGKEVGLEGGGHRPGAGGPWLWSGSGSQSPHALGYLPRAILVLSSARRCRAVGHIALPPVLPRSVCGLAVCSPAWSGKTSILPHGPCLQLHLWAEQRLSSSSSRSELHPTLPPTSPLTVPTENTSLPRGLSLAQVVPATGSVCSHGTQWPKE